MVFRKFRVVTLTIPILCLSRTRSRIRVNSLAWQLLSDVIGHMNQWQYFSDTSTPRTTYSITPAAQSGFRGHHSTETALLSLLSDIYVAIDQSHLSLLALFDVSYAFDMVDHEILLQRLELSCGLSGILLLWFKSYLTDRTQMVVLGDSRTEWVGVKFGVPLKCFN